MLFAIHQESRQGARHDNEDRVGYVFTQESLLMVVCDGMGGHANGEIAAQYVMEYFAVMFRARAKPLLDDPDEFLRAVFLGAHNSLVAFAQQQGFAETPRTTCVACIVQEGCATWAHAGDSRIYHLRGREVRARSEDHSYVQTLIDKGTIVAEEAYTHPERNKIYSCIGNVVPPKVSISASITLSPGDRVLLATDGIWGCLSDESIGLCLSAAEVPVSLSMLIDMAEVCSAGQSDNMSGILFEWIGSKKSSRNSIGTSDRIVTDNDIEVSLMLIHAASGRPAS